MPQTLFDDTPQASTSRVWPDLLPELAERIASCLPQNERACTLRLVNRAAATQFRGPQHTSVRLSQPVPPQDFARHWGAPGATRGLPYRLRLRLLCLTAASGSIPNMEVAMAAAGCLPTCKVLCAAAAAGQREMCEWLMRQRVCSSHGAAAAAAGAGRRDMCEWLISRGCDTDGAVRAAAQGGHVGLMEWLLQYDGAALLSGLGNMTAERYARLAAVAAGCDLATLQRLHREWLGGQAPHLGHVIGLPHCSPIHAAAASPTPDWRAKVEWLEGVGYPRTQGVCGKATACPDAVERLTWLRQRGYQVDENTALFAASAGNLAALQYLHAEGIASPLLAACEAATHGHLSELEWLVDTYEPAMTQHVHIFTSAAQSGSLELLTWLRERGCPWGEATFEAAARDGNEVALEWLAERGCPMPADGLAYTFAIDQMDTSTLHCLARLGCPWGTRVLKMLCSKLLHDGSRMPVLRALLQAGCPVNWALAEELVRGARRSEGPAVLALLAEERARREGRP